MEEIIKKYNNELTIECESIYNDLLERDAWYSPNECKEYVSNSHVVT